MQARHDDLQQRNGELTHRAQRLQRELSAAQQHKEQHQRLLHDAQAAATCAQRKLTDTKLSLKAARHAHRNRLATLQGHVAQLEGRCRAATLQAAVTRRVARRVAAVAVVARRRRRQALRTRGRSRKLVQGTLLAAFECIGRELG